MKTKDVRDIVTTASILALGVPFMFVFRTTLTVSVVGAACYAFGCAISGLGFYSLGKIHERSKVLGLNVHNSNKN